MERETDINLTQSELISKSTRLLDSLNGNPLNVLASTYFKVRERNTMIDFYLENMINELFDICSANHGYSVTYNCWPRLKRPYPIVVGQQLRMFLFEVIGERAIKEKFKALYAECFDSQFSIPKDLSVFRTGDLVRIYKNIFKSNIKGMFVILANTPHDGTLLLRNIGEEKGIVKVSKQDLLIHNPEYYQRLMPPQTQIKQVSSELVSDLIREYTEISSNTSKYSVKYKCLTQQKQLDAKSRLELLTQIIGFDPLIDKLNYIDNLVANSTDQQLEKYPLRISTTGPHTNLAKSNFNDKEFCYEVGGYDTRGRILTLYRLGVRKDIEVLNQCDFFRINPAYYAQIISKTK